GGIHPTIAGVVLGCMVTVARRRGSGPCLAEVLEHRIRPVSAGFAVPAFAFMAAGVTVSGELDPLSPVVIAVVAALLVGKPVGIVGTTWLVARFTGETLDPGHRWGDFFGVALLAGIGFTDSLLIAGLSLDGASYD